MKAVYYFSNKQRIILDNYNEKRLYINSIEYTEVRSYQDDAEHDEKNNFPDSVVVHVKTNLPRDEWEYKHSGKSVAKLV